MKVFGPALDTSKANTCLEWHDFTHGSFSQKFNGSILFPNFTYSAFYFLYVELFGKYYVQRTNNWG
jgi:hypothetical protein